MKSEDRIVCPRCEGIGYLSAATGSMTSPSTTPSTDPETLRARAAEMPCTGRLSDRQKQYIWLLGSFPDKIAVQGRGYRTSKLMWGIKDDELVIFGYSDPFLWLKNRGLVRKLDNANAYVLTEAGERAFTDMHVRGAGLAINRQIREVPVS